MTQREQDQAEAIIRAIRRRRMAEDDRRAHVRRVWIVGGVFIGGLVSLYVLAWVVLRVVGAAS